MQCLLKHGTRLIFRRSDLLTYISHIAHRTLRTWAARTANMQLAHGSKTLGACGPGRLYAISGAGVDDDRHPGRRRARRGGGRTSDQAPLVADPAALVAARAVAFAVEWKEVSTAAGALRSGRPETHFREMLCGTK